ncbi:hypothetical protein V866_004310 [Kwoniella sp. B9012]
MVVKQLLNVIALVTLVRAQSFIGCVDNMPSDTNEVEIEGDCQSTCKNQGYEYAFWSAFETDCQCGNSPPKTFMYNVAQDEYGKCLPYDREVTKIHVPFQFHLCAKTIELSYSKLVKATSTIVGTMSECFDLCPEADYIAIAPQWVKTTYECRCGGMPISYNPMICGEGTFYGYSNPSSKGNRRKGTAGKKSKPQRLGKQQVEKVEKGEGRPNKYYGAL